MDCRLPNAPRRSPFAAAVVCLALLTAAGGPVAASTPSPWEDPVEADADPPVIELLPVLDTPVGAPLTIKLRVTDASGVGDVRLLVRGEHDPTFRPVNLERHGSIFTARIAPGETRGTQVRLHVASTDVRGNGPALAGSPDRPLVVDLVPQEVRRPRALAASAGILFTGLLAMLGVKLHERRRRARSERARERRFWDAVVAPFGSRRGESFCELLGRVCATEIDHPTRGRVTLQRAEVLAEIRRRS